MCNMCKITKKQIDQFVINYIGEIFALLIIIVTIIYIFNGFKITESAYYYSLSTIAQTLAAMIAFTGMFVVFRLQIIKDKREKLYTDLEDLAKKAKIEPHFRYVEEPPYYNELFSLHDLDDEERINRLSIFLGNISQIDKDLIPHEVRGLKNGFAKKITQINELKGEYSKTKNLMSKVSISSIISIIFSIFFLAFVKPCSTIPLYIVGVIVALSCYSILEIFKSFLRFLLTD